MLFLYVNRRWWKKKHQIISLSSEKMNWIENAKHINGDCFMVAITWNPSSRILIVIFIHRTFKNFNEEYLNKNRQPNGLESTEFVCMCVWCFFFCCPLRIYSWQTCKNTTWKRYLTLAAGAKSHENFWNCGKEETRFLSSFSFFVLVTTSKRSRHIHIYKKKKNNQFTPLHTACKTSWWNVCQQSDS